MGKVLHLVKRGFVVKAVSKPKLGRPIFDPKKRRVGNIIDVFGPVSSPYALVKPATGLTVDGQKQLIGADVFMGEDHGKRQR